MSQGRGSAFLVVVAAVLLLLISADAATYTVGGPGGWTFNIDSWPRGKTFRAGDTLIFNYNSAFHNVVPVNRAGYNGCSTPRGSRVLRSGKDQIRLARGQNYFICNFQGHCESGMKIAINAV